MLGMTANPRESYGKIALDARIEGSDGKALSMICFERAVDELRYAGRCEGPDRKAGRITALQRAANAVLALKAGVEDDNVLRESLLDFYTSIYAGITGLSQQWDAQLAVQLSSDLDDIAGALKEG
jgi:hypothetical protein